MCISQGSLDESTHVHASVANIQKTFETTGDESAERVQGKVRHM